jgi:hypothetical protein
MTTLLSVVFALAFGTVAAAQPQQDGNPPVGLPTAPLGTKPPPPGSGAAATANALKILDAAIKDLSENTQAFVGCSASLDYLRQDLANTKARLRRAGGGKIASSQAGLVVLKTKRLGQEQKLCLDQVKILDAHYTAAVRGLSTIQPANHAGIPPRRAKLLEMREKFTAAVKKLRSAKKDAAASDSDDSTDGGDQGSDK